MCLNPLYLRVPSTTFGVDIPIFATCGKCIECVVERQNAYKIRLCYEARRWKHCFFFTLTYRDSSLPLVLDEDSGALVSTCKKDHVRAWLKVMRERYLRSRGCRFEFRYFICSEYGSEDYYVDDRGRTRKATGRPHYHGIIFCDDSPEFLNEMFDEWRSKYGRVDAKKLKTTKKQPDIREHRSKVANYVAKYCCKGEFSTRVDDVERGVIEPSWFILSNGIGSNYVDDMRLYHLVQDGLFSFNLNYLPKGSFTIDGCLQWFRDARNTLRQAAAESIWNYVNEVVDRMVVYDGNAPYKMPRYFRQKIYGTTKLVTRFVSLGINVKVDLTSLEQVSQSSVHGRFCRPAPVYTYYTVEKTFRVPSSENFLSACIALVLRHRHDVRSAQEFYEFIWDHRHLGTKKAIRLHEIHRLRSQKERANLKRSKLRNFYQKKHIDNPLLSA